MTLTEEQRERLIEGIAQDHLESYADNLQVFDVLKDALINGCVGFVEYQDSELIDLAESRGLDLDEILGDSDET